MPTNSSAGMSTATSSDELVTAKTVHPDTFVTAPVSTCVARAAYHPASGVFHTTAKETANSSPAMSVNLSTTTEVAGIMANHIQGVSTATVSGAVNTDQVTKKRKSKDQRTRKWPRCQGQGSRCTKKNLTAYMHYATYARAYLKPRNPQLKGGELTKNVVQRGWNRLSSQERHYWDEKAAADKMRYERDLAKYKKSELGVAWQARVVEKSKQATSGYIFDTNAGKKAKDSFAQSKTQVPTSTMMRMLALISSPGILKWKMMRYPMLYIVAGVICPLKSVITGIGLLLRIK
ncbi:high mobility group protein [Skeletonema marinoi]|uniref:High mobility group protein n=1 Tax=Skeletonema marinoi TaxID=267567 RepID=A0AAD8YDV9_9STRA|nr:high mobility group protein [Skeletonema marinoi]